MQTSASLNCIKDISEGFPNLLGNIQEKNPCTVMYSIPKQLRFTVPSCNTKCWEY